MENVLLLLSELCRNLGYTKTEITTIAKSDSDALAIVNLYKKILGKGWRNALSNPLDLDISNTCISAKQFECLGKMSWLQTLYCQNCPSLATIPTLANLKELYCQNCTGLATIPTLANLKELYCQNCPSLATIPTLANLQTLVCAGCTGLATIPTLANLQRLYCQNCPSLATIPTLANLQRLYCDGCTGLDIEAIQASMPNCKIYC